MNRFDSFKRFESTGESLKLQRLEMKLKNDNMITGEDWQLGHTWKVKFKKFNKFFKRK